MKEIPKIKNYIRDVSGDWPGNVYLAMGKRNILLDSGMACCGEALVRNIETVLKGGTLDYVFLTHSHFDHISGVPYLRRKWPDMKVYIGSHGKDIMEKPSALGRIREMNEAAAADQGIGTLPYRDEDLYADYALRDGQMFQLEEWKITAIETPGHTRDCFSFLIEREACPERILLCAETAGVYAQGEFFSPCFLLGYDMSVASMKKMENIGAELLIFAHTGFGSQETAEDIWKRCFADHKLAVQRIRRESEKNIPLEEKIKNLAEYYWPEELQKYQPYQAYAVNMKSMLERGIFY